MKIFDREFLKIAFLSLLMVLAGIACSSSNSETTDTDVDPPADTSTEFSVMSYNIRGNTFSTHKATIVSQIQNNSIDILGIQELGGTNKAELTNALGNGFSLIETFPASPTNSTHNIVYNNQTFSIIDFGYQEVDICGLRRFINWVLLEKKNTSTRYYIYNNHLCQSDLELRKRHLVELVTLMEAHRSQSGANYRAIVTGDFNSGSGTEFINFLLQNGSLTIGSDTFTNPVQIIDTWNAIHPGSAKPSQGNVAIDWIFATPNIGIENVSADTSTNAQNQLPSDHYPIVTIFE